VAQFNLIVLVVVSLLIGLGAVAGLVVLLRPARGRGPDQPDLDQPDLDQTVALPLDSHNG